MAVSERPRRLRRTPALRRMVRETRLQASALIASLFVTDGHDTLRPISSMPGHDYRGLDFGKWRGVVGMAEETRPQRSREGGACIVREAERT
jgi:hypothetical protein